MLMATLTETAYKVRQIIKYGSLGSVVFLVLWFLGVAGVNYWKATHPAAPPAPTVDFGILAKIEFPKEQGRPAIELELPTGKMPVLPDRMTVYFAPAKRSGFLDPQTAIETASALGFIFKPEQPSETRYVWRKQDQMNSTLEMDITSGHFSLKRSWQNNPALLSVTNFVSDKQIITDASNYLSRADLLATDVVGNEKVSYLKSNGATLIPALSLSDAEFVQVDFFRNDIVEYGQTEDGEEDKRVVTAEYSFYRPYPTQGLIRAIVSASGSVNEKIIDLSYLYTKIEYDTKGEYPIKTVTQAWDELKNGDGYVTDDGPKSGTIKVRRIILGYYDTESNHKYTMPIYVFLGDQNFVAYVSAVTDDYMQ